MNKTIELAPSVTVLASNVPQTASEKSISVAVLNEDLMKGRPIFYAFRDGMLYDEKQDFKPINRSGGQKIKGEHVDLYYSLLREARNKYDELRSTLQTSSNNNSNSSEIEMLKNIVLEQKNTIDNLESKLTSVKTVANSPEMNLVKHMETIMKEMNKNVQAVKETLPTRHEFIINNEKTMIEDALHESFDEVLAYILKKQAVFLKGPAGTGKSHLCEQVAKVAKLDFYFSNAITQDFQLRGFIDANGIYRETEFYRAFTQGGLFFIDEMDASIPEALLILNSALAQKHFDFPNGRKTAHANFRLIAAGNTSGNGADSEYTGRFQLDASSLDRFRQVEIYYSPSIENAIANGNAELLEFIRNVRQTAERNEIRLLVTYRAISGIAEMEDVLPLEKIIKSSLIKSMNKDDLQMLIRNMSVSSENKYFRALKKIA